MRRLSRCILSTVLASASCLATAGDTLLIQRVQEKPANLPARGMSMAQVETKYGAPTQRMDARGGQRRAWPTINRWTYPTYTVYFEKSRVIDVVMTQSGEDEVGPKPATK